MTLHPDVTGERLDAYLANAVENMTRSAAQKLIEEGKKIKAELAE